MTRTSSRNSSDSWLDWLFLALFFAFTHGLASVLDRLAMKREGVNHYALAVVRYALNSFVALLAVLYLEGLAVPSSELLFTAAFLSLFWAGGALFYFKPLKHGDVSQLIPFREVIIALLSFSLAITFLGEPFSFNDVAGVLLVSLGGYALLTNGKLVLPKLSTPLLLIAGNGVLLAVWGVFAKPATLKFSPAMLNLFFYFSGSILLLAYMLARGRLSEFKPLLSDNRALRISLLASVSASIGTLSLFYALSAGFAAEVLPVTRSLVVFAAAIGWVFLKEQAGMARLLSALTVFAGVYLLAA
ncbi:MAG TPA: DMT family transporter [archaeon]|nr:DMT family transporter [archaeon]